MEPPSEPEPEPQPLAEASAAAPLRAPEVARLREEQEKVVTNCQEKIQHWEKVDNDYSALQERLRTLPDKLSYDVMVPFGPLAFMPGKLVHTNEEEDDDDDDDEDDDNESDHAISADNSIPTIYFSHTVEPKRVRINTGKNTTLKFSEKKEEAKRKRKSGAGSHATHELPAIKSPADIYRVFVDVVNGEYVPRKSILKSRSRENSVCSDTSESSAADVEDRRGLLRSTSSEEAVATEAGGSSLDELQENHPKKPLPSGVSEAFSGTVIEKEFLSPSLAPYSAIAHHALPTIPERKEVPSEVSEEPTKRVSKFRAARLQQSFMKYML